MCRIQNHSWHMISTNCFIIKVNQTDSSQESEVRCERKRGGKGNAKDFGLPQKMDC